MWVSPEVGIHDNEKADSSIANLATSSPSSININTTTLFETLNNIIQTKVKEECQKHRNKYTPIEKTWVYNIQYQKVDISS